MPESMPLFLRITATDWLEHEPSVKDSWKVEDTVRLAGMLQEKGVDLLDVSSGGNHAKQKIDTKAYGGLYQAVRFTPSSPFLPPPPLFYSSTH